MSIVQLSTGSMIVILEYYLQGKPRAILENNELLKPYISRLQSVHQELRSSREIEVKPLSAIEEKNVRDALNKLDKQHDDLQRIFHTLLTTVATHTEAGLKQQASQFLNALCPYGLLIVRMKWIEEAGETVRLEEQLQRSAVREYLHSIQLKAPGMDITALKIADEIVAIGQQMSGQLQKLLGASSSGNTLAETTARRNFTKWMRNLTDTAALVFDKSSDELKTLTKVLEEQIQLHTPDPDPSTKP